MVLLFGAGTDFCLFFLARCREVLERTPTPSRQHYFRAIGRAWRSVHHTIVASAMTTIVGLAMMWMSRFEKFRFSGPVIAISLAVTLTVCLTFTPAILSAIGRVAFWPSLRPLTASRTASPQTFSLRVWMVLANLVVGRPAAALLITTAILGVPAYYGWRCLGWVTYDFVEELSADAPSRRGIALTRKFFDTNDSSPVTIMVVREEPFASDEELRKASDKMSDLLYIDGVNAVRSVNDPLGDYPPHRTMGFLNTDAWRRRVLKEHRISKDRYLSPVDAYQKRLAKFEVVLSDNPFSLDAGLHWHRSAVRSTRKPIASFTLVQSQFCHCRYNCGYHGPARCDAIRSKPNSDIGYDRSLDSAFVFTATVRAVDLFDFHGIVQLLFNARIDLRFFWLGLRP